MYSNSEQIGQDILSFEALKGGIKALERIFIGVREVFLETVLIL